jgi:hypothetical protein
LVPDISFFPKKFEAWRTAAARTVLAAPTLLPDLVFTLFNDSTHSFVEMYVSPVGEDAWGGNFLTVDAVTPGMSGDLTIADGLEICDDDIAVVSDAGEERVDTQNLCELNVFTVTA